MLGVPILSLVMSPVQAAALLLPLLLAMDAVGLWTWRGVFDRATLVGMLPAAVVGIAVGGMTAAFTSEAVVRSIVGAVAVGFVVRSVWPRRRRGTEDGLHVVPSAKVPSVVGGWVWGAASGFTSFVAHAGGPAFQVHVLPMRMDPRTYTGTSVVFFAAVNLVKVVPYVALGQMDARTLVSASLLVVPAGLAVLVGAAMVRRMKADVFYPFMMAMVALVGLRLIVDGVRGLG